MSVCKRDDGVGEVLVEVAGLQEAGVAEAALVEDVVVVGVFGLQIGIADADGGRRGVMSGWPTAAEMSCGSGRARPRP